MPIIRPAGCASELPGPGCAVNDCTPSAPSVSSLRLLLCATFGDVLEVLEVDILWPRWVARIGVTRSTQACFLTADRQCTELPLLRLPRLVPEVVGCDPFVPRDLARVGWRGLAPFLSNMRGFDSYRLLTLSLAALMTRISSVVIEGAHTSAGAATLARTVPFWGRFRSPREPTAGPCRGCLLPSATNTAPSRHHLQAVLCDGWDVQTPPSWLLRPQTRELYGWS